jgi:hypothetical protein
MCDNCNDPEGRDCTGGAILAGCWCRNGEAWPVCGHDAGARVAAEPILLADIPDPGMLAEFDSWGLTDGNADRHASARRSARVRA